LTRRLLAFARRQPLHPVQIDVNERVSEMAKLLSRILGEGIRLSVDLASDLWPTLADPAQLEASISNLATNARDAMPRGGTLRITTDNRKLDEDYAATHPEVVAGDYVMIEASDTGIGMPPAVMARIFEPFFSTKEVGKGTGLGLSMVFGFMKQSGGHISVHSEPEIGTTFRLYLPRLRDAAAAEPSAETESLPMGKGETVLVVEDNPGLRRVVMRQLRDLGYRALEADQPAAAMALLEAQAIDILFTDVVMPGGVTGRELAQTARARWPRLRIVLTSGFLGTGDEAIQTERLLVKPYRKVDLARALQESLQAG
jgi:CheY-like chemotaxis protein